MDAKQQVDSPMNIMNRTTGSAIGYSYYIQPLQGYYTGIIDQVTFLFQVKDPNEILNEATLLAYYQFNSNQLLEDSGPNGISMVMDKMLFRL